MKHPPSKRRVRQAERAGHLPVSGVAVGLAALASLAAAIALGTGGLVDSIGRLAKYAWRGDAVRATDATTAVVRPLTALLLTAWCAALVVGLVQSRGRLARPGRRRTGGLAEQRRRRASELAIGVFAFPLVAVVLLDLLPFLATAVGVPVSDQVPALDRAVRGTLATTAAFTVSLVIAHAVARNRIWWRALHVDDTTHREDLRRNGTSEHVLRERRRRWREHRRQARKPAYIVLILDDPAADLCVALAFHPQHLPVPHVARVGLDSARQLRSLDAPRASDGPLARRLARVAEGHPVPDRDFRAVADHFFAMGIYVHGDADISSVKNVGKGATNR